MLLSEGKLLALVGQIYDAAGDPSLWPVFLEAFSNSVGGASTGIVYHDMTALRATMAVSARTDPQCEQLYLQHYGRCDPLRTAWLERFSRAGPDGVVTCEQVIDSAQLQKTEYYNDFLVPNHIVHQFCGPIAVNKDWSAVLTCLRPASKGPFGTEAVMLLRSLLPHLQRAIQFHRKFAELEGRHRGSLDALDIVPTGVIILDARGRIVALNRAASLVLEQNDGLTTDNGSLRASTPHETKQLRSAITTACERLGNGLPEGGCFRIARPSGKQSLALLIMRASAHSFAPDAGQSAGIVFVSDPETKARTDSALFARIYHFTEAESRLAQHLVQGETLVRAAELLGVSHNTARTHLQRIFGKTDTCHQGDLVRLLLAAAACAK
jgi:DNA-binding CsgD family transcriptional regulator